MEKPLSFVSPSLYGFLTTIRSSFADRLWFRNPQNKKPPTGEVTGFHLHSLASWFPFTGWLWHLVDQVAETVDGPVPSRLSPWLFSYSILPYWHYVKQKFTFKLLTIANYTSIVAAPFRCFSIILGFEKNSISTWSQRPAIERLKAQIGWCGTRHGVRSVGYKYLVIILIPSYWLNDHENLIR